MAKVKKTNAMRILDQKKIKYIAYQYNKNDGKIDGISVADKIGKDINIVYKTLVTQGSSKNIYVFVIPVAHELDLKKAAKVAREKKVEMIPVKDILKYTGYIRGGCSPIGMKKKYKTFVDASASQIQKIIVSAGKIGEQIELNVTDLTESIDAQLEDIIK
ncbi:Cys-tRNA(Pro) deacylase [Maledivibacter halophilus]|uniref:Cys-tRNA(Pro)/Cys-tRNA(Cys) deacylase n=1 Tax=Maledivibacter halophilus TaxID=36842 RepID=A0A1T5J7E3_9FIRM|nr:Cys-tRNA(Pro) deacylase [Maledivibacter halophilus]SKC47178.1 Cys-tRNA(Pro)/Cys-tRNA(Cys) deacylase [Maledivibacter halophilus]